MSDPTYTADRWPANGAAWHRLSDGQVIRAVRALRGAACPLEPGVRRWRLAAAMWQVEARRKARSARIEAPR